MVRRMFSHALAESWTSTCGRVPGVSGGGWGRVNMSLKIGDASDRMNLWTRKSRVPAARMIKSASSAQKSVDRGTVAVDSMVAVPDLEDGMAEEEEAGEMPSKVYDGHWDGGSGKGGG